MSAREELADLIDIANTNDTLWKSDIDKAADAILAAGYSKPRTISTVEELDALPDGSVVMNVYGDAITVHQELREQKPTAYHHLVKHGPATVLYIPKES